MMKTDYQNSMRRATVVDIRATYLGEPLLQFCTGRSSDPKTGLTVHGPYSLRNGPAPRLAKIGVIGSAETIAAARQWVRTCAEGVKGDAKHPDFPGCSADAGFFCDLTFDDSWAATLTRNERSSAVEAGRPRERFEAAGKLFDEKLAQLAGMDARPDYVILALPDDIAESCGVVKYREKGRLISRDLRRLLKAVAMRHSLPTQILRTRTILGGRGVDDLSRCAWNFFTGLYFKLGGVPWAPVGLDPDTCFVGISFFRPPGREDNVRASIARAFNGRGDAIVLRGDEFRWKPSERERSPHLSGEMAEKLTGLVLQRYSAETGKSAVRVVVQKTSQYWSDERDGFCRGLRQVQKFDLLAVGKSRGVRLLREGKYPTLRGTHVTIGETDYLYTTGYIPALGTCPHGHVPLPLQIADHHGGDTDSDTLLRELLILTKMNWNSADYASSRPVTLASADMVGEIMGEVPPEQDPLPNLKYYV